MISVQTRAMICEVATLVVSNKRKRWQAIGEGIIDTDNRKKTTGSMLKESRISLMEPRNSPIGIGKKKEAVCEEEDYFASDEGGEEDEEVVSDEYDEGEKVIPGESVPSGMTELAGTYMASSRRMIDGCFETPEPAYVKWEKLKHTTWAAYNNDGFEKGDELLSYQEFLDKRSERRERAWEDTLKKKREKEKDTGERGNMVKR